MTRIDNDLASLITDTALNMCHAIRRDYPWARSADSPARHAAIIADVRRNTIPRCAPFMRVIIGTALDHEAALFGAI